MDFASAQSTLRFVEDRARADQISPTDVLLHLLMSGKISDADMKAACNSDSIAELQKLKKDHEKTEEDAKSNIKPKSNEGEVQAKSSSSSSAKQQEQQIQPGQQRQQQQTARYRHVALLFHYDGASYSGFAQNLPPSNSNSTSASSATSIAAANDNSIERALFSALTRTCLITSRDSCNYSRAGRTDRGVSAWGQVVAMNVKSAVPLGARLPVSNDGSNDDGGEGGDDTEKYGREVTEADLPGSSDPSDALDCWAPVRTKKKGKGKKKNKRGKSSNGAEATADDADQSTDAPPAKLYRRQITELSYPRILNNVLPPTIRILGWCPVTPQFSARFSCSDRTYRYHFVRRNLNLDAMDEALQKMVGKHDFRNLCKMNVEQVYNFERVIKSARIVVPTSSSPDNDGDTANFYQACHFEIIGQAFLWHQIRCIVSILFMVGRGQESPDIVDHLLDIKTNPGKPAYSMADELPLVLHRCSYGGGEPNGGTDRVPFRRSVRDLWRVACDLEKRWEEMTLAAARLRDGLDCLKDEAVVSRADIDAFVADIVEERRKKSRRLPPSTGAKMVLTDGKGEASNGGYDSRTSLSWGDALSEISSRLGIQPTPEGPKEILHIPLLQRSRGTTYEEKIASLNAAAAPKDDKEETKKRRRERYEENIVRKRKTTEEDQAFYDHMLSQGAAASSASS